MSLSAVCTSRGRTDTALSLLCSSQSLDLPFFNPRQMPRVAMPVSVLGHQFLRDNVHDCSPFQLTTVRWTSALGLVAEAWSILEETVVPDY